MDAIFELSTSALPGGALLVAFHGEERLSTPYRFEIFASAPTAELDLGDAPGLKASLRVHHGGVPYDFHGVIAAAELVQEVGEQALVSIIVVPQVWMLGLSRHSRVFTKMKIPDVIQAVLSDAGIDAVELRLQGSYAVESHVFQYKESDLDFISRWMEREGMYYFFEQGDDAEKLIITDHKSSHAPLADAPVRYRPVLERDVSAGASFDTLAVRHQALPSKVKLKDYDYAKPSLDVSGEATVSGSGTLAEVVEHGARFFTPGDGKRLAQIRAEERLATQVVLQAGGMVFDLRPGYTFTLSEHPRDAMNRDYLCTALRHRGNQRATTPEIKRLTGIPDDETYRVEATAIPSDVQFRAPRRHGWPKVAGTERAIVDGAATSDYAQIDSDGRYNVKLACDESDLKNGNASTAIRMMQPHAGNPEGFHMPLRKGTEVIIGFVGGDPDRPIIAGTAPNTENPSPVTSANATRNIIHTGSDNHIEIEDKDGKQWIDIRTPPLDTRLHLGTPHDDDSHYITLHTGGDCLFDFGSNQDIDVGGKLTEKVTGAVDETYSTSQTSDVKGPQVTTIAGAVEEDYTGGHHTTTTGLVMELYNAGQKSTVSGGERSEKYNAAQTTIVAGGVTQSFKSSQELTQTGPSVQTYNGTLSSSATGQVTLQYDGAVTQNWGPVTATYGPTNWTIPGAANVFTSKFNLTMTAASWFAQMVTTLKLFKTEASTLYISIAAANYQALALSLSTNVMKVEGNGVSLSVFGASINLVSIKVEVSGTKTSKAATTLQA